MVTAVVVAGACLGAAGASATCFRGNHRSGEHCKVVPQAAQWNVGYAGVGSQTVSGQWPDNAGCVLKATTISNYAYLNVWSLSATIKDGKLVGIKSRFLRTDYPSGFGPADTLASINGSRANKPDGEQCQWPGGPDNRGTIECQAKPAPIGPIKELRLPAIGGRLLFEAGGFFSHSLSGLRFTGQDTVPQDQSSGGCGVFDTVFDSYWPLPTEAEISKVPVRVSTLIGLRRGHFFRVKTSPGHYAPAESKSDCLPPIPPQYEECAITDRTFRGELLVKRIH